MRSTDKEYGATANYAMQPDQPPPPLTDNVLERLNFFNQTVSESLTVAHNIKARLHGQEPEVDSSERPKSVANGFVEQFNEASGDLNSRLQRLDSLLREINSRL